MKRETLQRILRFIITHFTHLEFVGLEHLPSQGGIIIATNHLSRVDLGVLFVIPTRPEITALVTDKYKEYPLIRFIVTTAHTIWIDRSKADFTAFREAIEEIKRGKALGISPEGTRSLTGTLQEGKPGTVLLAQKAHVPIVPVGLSGTEDAIAKLLRFQKPHMVAHFGPAFELPPLGREDREAQMKQQTDEIMCRIAVLLPEKYRGFYADHPRVKELLAGQTETRESRLVLV